VGVKKAKGGNHGSEFPPPSMGTQRILTQHDFHNKEIAGASRFSRR
jgi:hypothetical protein